jgi:hypothetical protein
VVLADPPLARPADLPAETAFVRRAAKSSADISQEMNAIISALPRQWIYCCYNGEYFFTHFANPAASEKSSPSPPKSAA